MKKKFSWVFKNILKPLAVQSFGIAITVILVCLLLKEQKLIGALLLALVSGFTIFCIIKVATLNRILGVENGMVFSILAVTFFIGLMVFFVEDIIGRDSLNGNYRYINIGLCSGMLYVLVINLIQGFLKFDKKE